jgi:hypothetical protein
MAPVMFLWTPIVLSAVIVFVASSIMHMVLPYHRNDLRKVPKEDEAREALRRLNIPPGDYGIPHAGSMAGMKSPASLALLQNSIWYRRSWGTTFKSMFDGLVYGLLTAGTFGWLWPH